jgi:membrane dipeptidase
MTLEPARAGQDARVRTAVFDGHTDALTGGDPEGFLDRAAAGGLAAAIFAIFVPTPGHDPDAFTPRPGGGYDCPYSPPLDPATAAAECERHAAALEGLQDAGRVRIARTPADLDAAHAGGPPAAVLHLEGAEAIDPGLEALDAWHARGLRSLGPVWSRANAFGHGVPFAFPRSPDTGPGLTAAGVALVRRCAELGIAVDLSHLDEAGFWDVARLDCGPLVASHSAAHALCPSTRNLTDAQLDAIGASDGAVGIVFTPPFTRADGADEADTPLARIAEHARYVADRIGVRHVALGSDFDGAPMPAALADPSALPALLAALTGAGFGPDDVEAIAWGTWRRVLAAAWGA